MHYLRAATSERHRRLEDSLNLLRLDFTVRDYTRISARFFGFWQPWEQLAERFLGDSRAFFRERKRTAKLYHDLAQLGLSDAEIARLPLASRLPAIHSVDTALGSMYVTEGSTLGGQLLSRHFIGRVGVAPGQCTFFQGYGDKTGLMWKRFGAELSKRPPSSYFDMAGTANETFACLEEWLCG